MPHIKKTVVMFLVAAMLSGGAWYLNTTSEMSLISSSVLNASSFSCTENTLSEQAKIYRRILIRHKKAIVIKNTLQAEIELLQKNDTKNQLPKKEEALKILSRQIKAYYRFIRKYDTCKKEINLNPSVLSGVMSGEAKVVVSEKEYQAIAAFQISSPKGLNTYLQSIQFKINVLPKLGMIADKWFLLSEGANPIACQISPNPEIIDCEISGDMPVDIMSGTTRNYGIGAHITEIHGSGAVDIQISNISFNEGRIISDTLIQSPLLSFGIVVPVVAEVTTPVTVVQSERNPQVITPDTLPAQTESTTVTTTETVEPAVLEVQTETKTSPSDVSVEPDATALNTQEPLGKTESTESVTSESAPTSEPTSGDDMPPAENPPATQPASNPEI